MSVTTLNIIGLNSAIKRHGVAKWVKKQNPYIYCHKRHISDIETHTDWKMMCDEERYFMEWKQKRDVK